MLDAEGKPMDVFGYGKLLTGLATAILYGWAFFQRRLGASLRPARRQHYAISTIVAGIHWHIVAIQPVANIGFMGEADLQAPGRARREGRGGQVLKRLEHRAAVCPRQAAGAQLDAAEVANQIAATFRPDTLNPLQRRLPALLVTPGAVAGDGEAVRFIAHVLDQVQRR